MSVSFKKNNDYVQEDVATAIDFDDNGRNDGGIGKDVDESLQRVTSNDEEYLRTKFLDTPKNLEGGDVGLSFQLKMLEFMDSVNQEHKRRKEKKAQQDKIIKLFMLQGTRLSSSTKKFAKVNIPSTFSRLDKARKVKEFLLEIDNYYDVQWPKKDDKMCIEMTFLKDHAL